MTSFILVKFCTKLRNKNEFHTFFRNTNEKPSIYFYNGGDELGTRRYYPVNACLQEISKNLIHASEGKRPWEAYIREGLQHLQVNIRCCSCNLQVTRIESIQLIQIVIFELLILISPFNFFLISGTHRKRFYATGCKYRQIIHEHWQR